MNKPIQTHELLELTIDSMTSEGQGVAREDGFVYFVQGAVTGDVVRAKIVKRKKSYAICIAEKIIQETPFLNPDYKKYHNNQGGSNIFRLAYEQQIIEKKHVIKQAMSKFAGISDNEGIEEGGEEKSIERSEEKSTPSVLDDITVHTSPLVNRYRNKAIYPAGVNTDKEVDFGHYTPKSHDVVFTHDSILEHKDNADIIKAVKAFVNQKSLSAYNPKSHHGVIRSLLCRSNSSGQHMVCLIINTKRCNWSADFATYLQAKCPTVTHTGIVYNTEKTPVQLRGRFEMQTTEPFYDQLGEDVGDEKTAIRYQLSANTFFQVNRTQAHRLCQRVVELADITPHHTVWDIYCGVGTISAFLAQKIGDEGKLLGNEIVQSSVKNAQNNMKLNGITNAEFYVGSAEKIIPQWYKKDTPDVVVLDPPRKGVEPIVLEAIAHAQPQRIVYVSCKPATLARDIAYLQTQGYKLEVIEGYDFFPHTMHVECLALLVRV